jgi:hypothetical protein
VISADAVRFTRIGDASAPTPVPTPQPTPTPTTTPTTTPTPSPTPAPTPPPPSTLKEVIVDNSSKDFSAPGRRWFTARFVSGYLGSNYHARRTESTSDPATWSATFPAAGKWEVFARWPAADNRSASAPYVILHQGGSTTKYVNQRKNGNSWVSLGTYDFAAGSAPRVLLSCWTTSGNYVVADAIKFVPK